MLQRKTNQETIKPYLGTASDAKIAKMFNISRERVRQYRKKLNIPKYVTDKQRSWSKEELAILGQLPDKDIAQMLNIPEVYVARKRLSLGIKFKYNVVIWTDEMLNKIGTMSDKKVAKHYNISATTVRNKRKELAIPSFASLNKT